MHHATDLTVRQSLGGYRGERLTMYAAAGFWFVMLIVVPGTIVYLAS